jgi:hypothetical protein
MLIECVRISTQYQNLDLQIDDLKKSMKIKLMERKIIDLDLKKLWMI